MNLQTSFINPYSKIFVVFKDEKTNNTFYKDYFFRDWELMSTAGIGRPENSIVMGKWFDENEAKEVVKTLNKLNNPRRNVLY